MYKTFYGSNIFRLESMTNLKVKNINIKHRHTISIFMTDLVRHVHENDIFDLKNPRKTRMLSYLVPSMTKMAQRMDEYEEQLT